MIPLLTFLGEGNKKRLFGKAADGELNLLSSPLVLAISGRR